MGEVGHAREKFLVVVLDRALHFWTVESEPLAPDVLVQLLELAVVELIQLPPLLPGRLQRRRGRSGAQGRRLMLPSRHRHSRADLGNRARRVGERNKRRARVLKVRCARLFGF